MKEQKKTELHRTGKVEDVQTLEARELFNSTRGSYIIGQALTIAKRVLLSGEFRNQEPSNAADMERLQRLFLCIEPEDSKDGIVVGVDGEGKPLGGSER